MTKPVWSHVLTLSALPTIPDSIKYIIAITLNHRRTFLLNINTLACVKAKISTCSGIHTSHTLCRITQA